MHKQNTGKADQGGVKIVRFTVRMYCDCYCDAVYSSINVHSFLQNLLSVLRTEEGVQLFVAMKVQEVSFLKFGKLLRGNTASHSGRRP
jgi:hypothetical protein